MQNNISDKNSDRFNGFADIYDSARPALPQQAIEVIKQYLEKAPDTVVDLGCGTGLSAIAWKQDCNRIIGVDPNSDMIEIAKNKSDDKISFLQNFSHDTGLTDGIADVVFCSQSFHWMEPVSTLKEVNRILAGGGIFATVDYDWPPVTKWLAEREYTALYSKAKRLAVTLPDIKSGGIRYDKSNHLANLQNSGYFKYCREILFSNIESCTASRLIDLVLSQSDIQSLIKKRPDMITDDIANFKRSMHRIFDDSNFEISFCYRMRIAVK